LQSNRRASIRAPEFGALRSHHRLCVVNADDSPQARPRAVDGLIVGHRNTIPTDMHTLVEESRWERLSRGLMLGALPLSMLAFIAL